MPITLITGCSSGIGLATARALKAAGHSVWATARSPEDVARLAAEGFVARQLDVTDSDTVQALAAELPELDVLINNAGYGLIGPLLDMPDAALRAQFDTNLIGLLSMTRACLPALRRRQGLVVNIGSVSALMVTPFAGAYCASKAAVHAASDALRMELAPLGVRLMEVQPGAIATRFAEQAGLQAEQVIDEQSPWWPWREQVRKRAQASQQHGAAPEAVGRAIADALNRAPRVLRVGNGSRALPWLVRWLPGPWLDRILSRRFGL
ncbi:MULTISPECIES: SDR family oxidoreductase [unclassified Pseudomonas]|uniref:SDR family oxidoreductase n=1 Tax=unclassified Pseudomonas TaxID=196821 RepID=UPI000BDB42D5|nr:MULTISPECIES: SDR family oxidoreductase [unclassified Pseudomonas]PVZ16017.1 short-subunit dehydrogenase [Pseudomonas sp. URIL14HWK12:I12]PVZ26127.1 short-subunit dehydrogenase [Pseudomonas sp. URIL14HWK12:I10]PVZ36349.1 short-subunit dehydrogenase [Pseudomonas sp. URIL14HWK12:I11]SNZ18411.1 Short-chain dehydrogenase [Pseudomonas sp. URIL14HWK12:I9]